MQSVSNDMHSLFQIFLLFFTTLLYHIGISNPNLSSTDDYVPHEGIGSKFLIFSTPKIGQLLTWISTLCQALYLFLQTFSPALISILFPQISTSINSLPLTSISILGYILMIIGGFGRIWCYKILGKLFTFEITIRNTHKLIKTGPYAYVRHPSYTFVCILAFGMFFVHQRLKNLFPNSTWLQIQFGPIGFIIFCLVTILSIKRRVIREEEELAKSFGMEWTEYVSKTKRFIPKII
ncbi:unnamed protein product [Rotaria sp. Silwood1]|nr:unnamed protein product [Rotaria sp. Silwood1]CAF3755535.1 unnamed protein product [Rotaria sp. Silwood1]CAF4655288.1 unnamed protein product [Rotaria sp. Silwood1]CAF4907782.1 unnamed protein product [Rotaria sp. Silwood1]